MICMLYVRWSGHREQRWELSQSWERVEPGLEWQRYNMLQEGFSREIMWDQRSLQSFFSLDLTSKHCNMYSLVAFFSFGSFRCQAGTWEEKDASPGRQSSVAKEASLKQFQSTALLASYSKEDYSNMFGLALFDPLCNSAVQHVLVGHDGTCTSRVSSATVFFVSLVSALSTSAPRCFKVMGTRASHRMVWPLSSDELLQNMETWWSLQKTTKCNRVQDLDFKGVALLGAPKSFKLSLLDWKLVFVTLPSLEISTWRCWHDFGLLDPLNLVRLGDACVSGSNVGSLGMYSGFWPKEWSLLRIIIMMMMMIMIILFFFELSSVIYIVSLLECSCSAASFKYSMHFDADPHYNKQKHQYHKFMFLGNKHNKLERARVVMSWILLLWVLHNNIGAHRTFLCWLGGRNARSCSV